MHISVRAEQGEGSSGVRRSSKPDSVLGEYFLSGNLGNLASNSSVYWREKLHERFRKVFFLHEVKLIYSLFQT